MLFISIDKIFSELLETIRDNRIWISVAAGKHLLEQA